MLFSKRLPRLIPSTYVPNTAFQCPNIKPLRQDRALSLSPRIHTHSPALAESLASNTIHAVKVYPPPPSHRSKCPEPLKTFTSSQIAVLDPSSTRTRLFARTNPDSAKVGDILLVRFKSGDPFSGVCLNIRRRGVDTSVLLRAQLTRIGTEMWIKIYSPTVVGIEVVQRAEKRARRARLYYMRKPEHDRGNIQGIVDNYVRTRTLLRGNSNGGRKVGGSSARKEKK